MMDNRQFAQIMSQNSVAINGLREDFKSLIPPKSDSYDSPYSFIVMDLTTARTDDRITMQNPVKFLQFWSDGGLQGISVKLGVQNNAALKLDQMRTIPINQTYKDLYLSNDVRQGRSILVIYFVRQTAPLDLALGGQDISLAELAARLGSIHTFDRRGEVLWKDDFEDGITRWSPATDGVGGSVVASSAYAKNGAVSAKLTTGNLIDNYALIQAFLSFPKLTKIGFEISFSYNDSLKAYQFGLELNDGVNFHSARLRYTTATGTLAIRTGIVTWVDLTPTQTLLNGYHYLFNTMKLVFDTNAKKYVRAILNNQYYDISQYNVYSTPSVTAPYILSFVNVTTGVNSIQSTYVDDAIITQNEP
jgi:hypothetical protein